MKRSKMFIAMGTVVLAISAVFATKANKRFNTVSTAIWKAKNGASTQEIFVYASSLMTTKSAVGEGVLGIKIYTKHGTTSGNLQTSSVLVTKTASAHQVFYK